MSEHTTTAAMPIEDPYEIEGELPPRPRRKLLTPLTGALAAVVLAGAGFIGGVQVQKHHGGSSNAAAPTNARAAFAPGGGGAQPTIGTVSSAHGSVLYVKESSGTVVRVKTTSASKVTRAAASSARGVHPGDTVIVQGSTAKSGTITATRVTATQAGASAFPGGGGGFFGGRGTRPPSGG